MFLHHPSKFGEFSLKIGGEIICQSWPLLTPFFNFRIVHWGDLVFFGYNVLTHCKFPPIAPKKSKNPKKKKEHVESDSKFMVESEKTKDTFYTCDMLSGYCSCPVGSTCASQNCSFLCSSSQWSKDEGNVSFYCPRKGVASSLTFWERKIAIKYFYLKR